MSGKKRRRSLKFDQLPVESQMRYMEAEGFVVGKIVCHHCGLIEEDVTSRPGDTQKVRKCMGCSRNTGEFKRH